MTAPRDDETRPLPPTSGEQTAPVPPVEGDPTAPMPPAAPADAPAWASAGGEQTDAGAPAPQDTRSRWTGRKTAIAVAAAIGLGTIGAVGATAAVAQSDSRGDELGPGGLGGRGQLPGGTQGRLPQDGQGRLPGAPPPGGVDRDGDRHRSGDRDGDHEPGGDGRAPGGGPGGGSTDPEDANGATTVLET